MEIIGAIECINAIKQGDNSFATLKGVVVGGDAERNDFYWCHKNFLIADVIIDKIPSKIKLSLVQDEEAYEFHRSIDRCSVFYSNVFVRMINLPEELKVVDRRGEHRVDISVIESPEWQEILPKRDYLSSFITLSKAILESRLYIDGFSLASCVVVDKNLRISLAHRCKTVKYQDVAPERIIAFKNFIISQLVYIITNYQEDNFENFVHRSKEFSSKAYAQYNHSSYIFIADSPEQISYNNIIIKHLFESIDFNMCTNLLDTLQKDIESLYRLNIKINTLSKNEMLNNKEVVDRPKESRARIKERSSQRFGYIDNNSNIVIECIYQIATEFCQGVAIVALDNKFGAIDLNGAQIVELKYDNLEYCPENQVFTFCKEQRWGIISRADNIIVANGYRWIGRFYNSLARFEHTNSKIGFISPRGEIVITPEWDDATEFKTGFAMVRKGEIWHKINNKGKIIC